LKERTLLKLVETDFTEIDEIIGELAFKDDEVVKALRACVAYMLDDGTEHHAGHDTFDVITVMRKRHPDFPVRALATIVMILDDVADRFDRAAAIAARRKREAAEITAAFSAILG
jgi:hypothetical protein